MFKTSLAIVSYLTEILILNFMENLLVWNVAMQPLLPLFSIEFDRDNTLSATQN